MTTYLLPQSIELDIHNLGITNFRTEIVHKRVNENEIIEVQNALLYLFYVKAKFDEGVVKSDDNFLISFETNAVCETVTRFSTSVTFNISTGTEQGEVKFVLVYLIR